MVLTLKWVRFAEAAKRKKGLGGGGGESQSAHTLPVPTWSSRAGGGRSAARMDTSWQPEVVRTPVRFEGSHSLAAQLVPREEWLAALVEGKCQVANLRELKPRGPSFHYV